MSHVHVVSEGWLKTPSPHSKGSGQAQSRLPLHPHLPQAPSFIPLELTIPLPSHWATRPARDPPVPLQSWVRAGKAAFTATACAALSRLLMTFSTQYTKLVAGKWLFLYSFPASQRSVSSSSCSPHQPLVVSPCFSERFQGSNKICNSTKTLKLPIHAQEAP